MNLPYWSFLTGIGCFLLSIRLVENSLKSLASHRFKNILHHYTNNHFKSIIMGTFATAVLQSSSAVTLMLLALVGSGIIQLSNALGIILGANLGTTFTGWVVSYFGFKANITQGIYPLMAIGSLLYVLSPHRSKKAIWGLFFFGIGFLFFSLDLIKDSTAIFQGLFDPSILAEYHYLIFAIAGALFTALIQSSSITMSITLVALNGGLIPLTGAAALMVGAGLGTTITVIIGSIAGGHLKKQVAAAHFLFNLITGFVALALLPIFLEFAIFLTGKNQPLYTLVTFYSGFNLIGIILFFPFLKKFSLLLKSKFPERAENIFTPDISPSHPEAALIFLKEEMKKLIFKALKLNLYALKDGNGLNEQYSLPFSKKSKSYEDSYKFLKSLEAALIEYAISIQENPLSSQQSFDVKQTVSSLRNCAFSAKSLKDIRHNLNFFKNESNPSLKEIPFDMMKSSLEIYKKISLILESEEKSPTLFEEMACLLADVDKAYLTGLQVINLKSVEKKIETKHITNLYNTNREVYNANHYFLMAMGDLFFNSQESEDFAQIPGQL
jgi:phosphate:Na+ symporter